MDYWLNYIAKFKMVKQYFQEVVKHKYETPPLSINGVSIISPYYPHAGLKTLWIIFLSG